MSGKGSAPRPKSVPDDAFSANWSLIFGEAAEATSETVAEVERPSQPAAD